MLAEIGTMQVRSRSATRVVDYKSGSGKARKIGETDFQVPLYALVAKRLGAARSRRA